MGFFHLFVTLSAVSTVFAHPTTFSKAERFNPDPETHSSVGGGDLPSDQIQDKGFDSCWTAPSAKITSPGTYDHKDDDQLIPVLKPIEVNQKRFPSPLLVPPPSPAARSLPPNPLPEEKDGVLPNGTVINAAADSPQSCWTAPIGAPILGIDSGFSPGRCQVCIIAQNVTSPGSELVFSFELWVRDHENHAIGGIGPVTLVPFSNNSISFATAGKWMNMIFHMDLDDRSYYSFVKMEWNRTVPIYENDAATMQFWPYSDPDYYSIDQTRHNCNPTGSAQHGAISYFQCSFSCV